MVNFEEITLLFEQTIKHSRAKLHNLLDQGKVSLSYAEKENDNLNNYIAYQQFCEKQKASLEAQIERYKNTIFKLEAVCALHGIKDLRMWMSFSTQHLVNDVVEQYEKRGFYLPFAFREYMHEDLTLEEQSSINRLIYKKRYIELDEIARQLKEIKTTN